MSTVSKGATSSAKTSKRSAPKLGDLLAEPDDGAVAYISRKGADSAFIIPPGPKHNRDTGVQIGWDDGVHLDFRGVGVTGPYFPTKNKKHRELCARIDEAMADGLPICEDLGLEVLKPDAPRPPFAKWDKTSAPAIKVALSVLFDDDHDKNVELVKQAAKYETANQKRKDVLDVLQGLLATEAAESDAFDVEVSVS
jgi:hypothetical protein